MPKCNSDLKIFFNLNYFTELCIAHYNAEHAQGKFQQWRKEHYEAIMGNAKLKSVKYKVIDINSTHSWTSK